MAGSDVLDSVSLRDPIDAATAGRAAGKSNMRVREFDGPHFGFGVDYFGNDSACRATHTHRTQTRCVGLLFSACSHRPLPPPPPLSPAALLLALLARSIIC